MIHGELLAKGFEQRNDFFTTIWESCLRAEIAAELIMDIVTQTDRDSNGNATRQRFGDHVRLISSTVIGTLLATIFFWVFGELNKVDVLTTKIDLLEEDINEKFSALQNAIEKSSINPTLEKIEANVANLQNDLTVLKISSTYWQRHVETRLTEATKPAAGPINSNIGDSGNRYIPEPYRPMLPQPRQGSMP